MMLLKTASKLLIYANMNLLKVLPYGDQFWQGTIDDVT